MSATKAKTLLNCIILGVAVVALTACGQRENRPIYTQESEVEELEAPEGLDKPSFSRTYVIPGEFLPELAGQRDESRPPRVLSSEEVEQARSRIQFGSRGLYLEVDDEAGSVFRRLGFALERDGMRVLESDPDEDMYLFRLDHEPIVEERRGVSRLAFWRRAAIYDYSGEYRIELEEQGDRTRVNLLDSRGDILDLDPAEMVLSRIRDRLG